MMFDVPYLSESNSFQWILMSDTEQNTTGLLVIEHILLALHSFALVWVFWSLGAASDDVDDDDDDRDG